MAAKPQGNFAVKRPWINARVRYLMPLTFEGDMVFSPELLDHFDLLF